MTITALTLVLCLMESLLFLFVLGLWPIGIGMLVLVAVLSYGLHGLYNRQPKVRTNMPPNRLLFQSKITINENSHSHHSLITRARADVPEIACVVYRGRGASRE